MFVKRDFWRIKSDRKPKASTFENNNYKYGEMLVKKHRYTPPANTILP
jgi:hypothetical protein